MSEPESEQQYKVQVGMTVTGEITVAAESDEQAREIAKRQIKREPFNGTEITECFTNNVREW
jgi:hypothetical protein